LADLAIDALHQSLSSLVFDALPEQRSSVLAFGVNDGGCYAPDVAILSKNKIDAQSFISIILFLYSKKSCIFAENFLL